MADDNEKESAERFERFEDLTKDLLRVSKEDLARAEKEDSDAPRDSLGESG